MCTFTEELHPFHTDRQKLVGMRATLVDAKIVDVLGLMTPIAEHDGGYSTPIRAMCPYSVTTGGTCLEHALSIIFPNRPPFPNYEYRKVRERTSNKNSF